MTSTQTSLTISNSSPFFTIAVFSQDHAGLCPLQKFGGHLNKFVLYFTLAKGGIQSLYLRFRKRMHTSGIASMHLHKDSSYTP